MPSLVIFTAPKPFTNPHVAAIQRNAIRSWQALGNEVEVIVFGNESGTAEACAEIGVLHRPDVRLSQWGTPLISSMFDLARLISDAPYLAIFNADVLLLPDFVSAVLRVASQTKNFLAMSRRWDLDVQGERDFGRGWDDKLRAEVRARGRLHPPVGSDYYAFPRHLLQDMPDFAIGRSGWDNWMIYHARRSAWAVVDLTPSVTIVHQNHDYSHLPGNKPPYDLPETQKNVSIAGGMKHMYTILEANKELINGQIRPARLNMPRLLHRLELLTTADDLRGFRKVVVQRLKRMRRRYEK
jgi:hypothetical protein